MPTRPCRRCRRVSGDWLLLTCTDTSQSSRRKTGTKSGGNVANDLLHGLAFYPSSFSSSRSRISGPWKHHDQPRSSRILGRHARQPSGRQCTRTVRIELYCKNFSFSRRRIGSAPHDSRLFSRCRSFATIRCTAHHLLSSQPR